MDYRALVQKLGDRTNQNSQTSELILEHRTGHPINIYKVEKLSDISLVTKVVMLHDRKSFDLLVRKYQSPIRGFFLRQTLGDAQLSDDLAQDTFVKAYTHLSGFRGTASFSTWLYRIAYNVWYDYTRSHKETQDIDTPAVSSKNAQGAHAGLKMDLLKALQILSENERTCIHAAADGWSLYR